MRSAALAGICFVVVFAGGFLWFSRNNSKPKNLILGKWEVTEPEAAKRVKTVLEFRPDGTTTMSISFEGVDHSITGKYKFTEDDLVESETEMTDPATGKTKVLTSRQRVTATKDSLTLTPVEPEKFTMKLRRIG